jgi:hypothetical protein
VSLTALFLLVTFWIMEDEDDEYVEDDGDMDEGDMANEEL